MNLANSSSSLFVCTLKLISYSSSSLSYLDVAQILLHDESGAFWDSYLRLKSKKFFFILFYPLGRYYQGGIRKRLVLGLLCDFGLGHSFYLERVVFRYFLIHVACGRMTDAWACI